MAPLIVGLLRDMLLQLKGQGLTMLLCEQNIAAGSKEPHKIKVAKLTKKVEPP